MYGMTSEQTVLPGLSSPRLSISEARGPRFWEGRGCMQGSKEGCLGALCALLILDASVFWELWVWICVWKIQLL